MKTVGLVLFIVVCVLLILFDLLMILSMIPFSRWEDRKNRKRRRKNLRKAAKRNVNGTTHTRTLPPSLVARCSGNDSMSVQTRAHM